MRKQINSFQEVREKNNTLTAIKELGNYINDKANSGVNKYIYSRFRSKKYSLKWGDSTPEPYNLIEVDPNMIEYNTKPSFSADLSKYGTYIIGGDWDKPRLSRQEWESESDTHDRCLVTYDNDIYQSIKERFEEGVNWWDTPIGKRFKNDEWYKSSIPGPEERFDEIERLYQSMKKSGYKTQRQLGENSSQFTNPEYNEVCVNICRDGTFAFESNGHHRLSVAKVLELEKIPVRVLVRHSHWQELKHEYLNKENTVPEDGKSRLLEHPDIIST